MNQTSSDPEQPQDPLEVLLRESEEYIPDNGFTTRVLASLPRRRQHRWLRLTVLSLATIAGTLMAIVDWHRCAKAVLDTLAWNGSLIHWQAIVLLLPVLAALVALGYGIYAIISEES